MAEAFVLETLRTARTRASGRGGLAGVSPVELLVRLQRELVGRTGVDPGRVEDVIIGCASQNGEQGANIARTATLLAGWGDVPGVTINRFCASGIDAVAQAGARIRGGDLELAAGGTSLTATGSRPSARPCGPGTTGFSCGRWCR